MKKFKKFYPVLLILVISLFAIKPLFTSGFFPMHDDTQPARIFEMGKALEISIPGRWAPDLGYGYGYPIFTFYAPLAYYMGSFINFFVNNPIVATKTAFGLGLMLASIFMYFLGEELFGVAGGILASLLYMFAPYHAVDLYVRGDLAELWAYALLPLVLWSLLLLRKEKEKQGLVIGSLGLAGVILSHNLTAFMLIPFFVLFSLFILARSKDKVGLSKKIVILILGGILLSAFYWVPALSELKYTNILSQVGGGADFRNHFVCLSQLWDSPWGFGGSVPGCLDGLSFRLGKIHVILAVTSILFFAIFDKKRKDKYLFWFLMLSLVLSLFMTLSVSQPVWEAIPILAILQYPWRFLVFASLFSSFLGGYVLFVLSSILKKEYMAVLTIVLIVFVLGFYLKLFNPQTIVPSQNEKYTSKENLNWSISKISDEYLPKDVKKPQEESQVFRLNEKSDQKAVVTVINQNILFQQNAKYSSVEFRQTPIEIVSDFLSLAGFVALILGILSRFKTHEK